MSTSPMDAAAPAPRMTADAFAERVLAASLGWVDLMSAYLGVRLGWYRALQDAGPATADELAQRTGTAPRYAREWLEQQAVSGVLVLEEGDDGKPSSRRYTLPPGAAEALLDERSLAFVGGMPRLFAAAAVNMHGFLEAYRTGGGVSWEQLGADAREAQASLNRPWFDALPGAIAPISSLTSVLERPGARVADVGTGAGWSSIALAQAYPGLSVAGFDIDEPSIELARANADESGVADRVTFHNADGDGLENQGPFDAAFAFECIHDMSQPVHVLRAMRLAVREGGPVIVMDEAVGDRLVAPGDEVERLMYGYSLFCCLPDGLSHQPSVGTGTVMRPDTLRGYALEAGFADLEILPIEDFGFFRFYSLLS